jgi:hypothetical protein
MEDMTLIHYHDLRKLSPEKAREIVRKVLANQHGNVSKTADILGIARSTIKRAREGTLADQSRRPRSSPKKIESRFETLIVKEAHETRFRYRRLTAYLKRK